MCDKSFNKQKQKKAEFSVSNSECHFFDKAQWFPTSLLVGTKCIIDDTYLPKEQDSPTSVKGGKKS
jgi:hypothetical protein